MKKQIVVIADSLEKGGAEKMAVTLCRNLNPHHNISLFVLRGNNVNAEFLDIIRKEDIKYVLSKSNPLKTAIDLYTHLKNNKTQAIFSFLLRGNFYAGVIGKIAGVRKIYGGIRSSVLDKNKIPLQRFIHRYLHTATITNNYASIKYLSKHKFIEQKIKVIQNCIPIPPPSSIAGEREKVSILTVARFDHSKDFNTALKAIHVLNESALDFIYKIIGWGELESEIRELIKEYNLQNKVLLIINPNNITEHYQQADIYLSTSLFEGLSNSIMEAMSYSLPVVATKVGDNNTLIIENKTGLIVSVGDYNYIAQKLLYLAQNRNIRLQMGAQAYQHIVAEFSEKKFLQKYLELINE